MAIDRAYATYDFIWLCSNFEIEFAFIALEILNITKLKKVNVKNSIIHFAVDWEEEKKSDRKVWKRKVRV